MGRSLDEIERAPAPVPNELRVAKDRRSLSVAFDDGQGFQISAELLRVESPSAEVQGHGPGQKQLVLGKEGVAIASMEPNGNYAVRIRFDDGHSTGIYSWRYLRYLGENADALMSRYREAAAAGG